MNNLLASGSYSVLGTSSLVKVPQPGDSNETFSVFNASCHLLLPVEPFKGRDNPVKCLAQEHKRTFRIILALFL